MPVLLLLELDPGRSNVLRVAKLAVGTIEEKMKKCTGLNKWEKWGCVRSAAAVLRRRPERSVSLDRCSETEEAGEENPRKLE